MMRRFKLLRIKDHSGVSGTGAVAEGCEFSNGQVAVTWMTPFRCVSVWTSIKELEAVHGHDGDTLVAFED